MRKLRFSRTENRLFELLFSPLTDSDQLWDKVADILPQAFEEEGNIGASVQFKGTPHGDILPPDNEQLIAAPIIIDDHEEGKLVVFYTEEKPRKDVGPFSLDEYQFLRNAGVWLSFIAGKRLESLRKKEDADRLRFDLREERLKNRIMSVVFDHNDDIHDLLNKITHSIAANFGKIVNCYIEIQGFSAGEPVPRQTIQTVEAAISDGDLTMGRIIVYFRAHVPEIGVNIFTREDKVLVAHIADVLRSIYLYRLNSADTNRSLRDIRELIDISPVPIYMWNRFGELVNREYPPDQIGPSTPNGKAMDDGIFHRRSSEFGTIAAIIKPRRDTRQLDTAESWVDSLTTLLTSMPVSMAVYDMDGRIVTQTNLLTQQLGYQLNDKTEKELFGSENTPSKTIAHLVRLSKERISRDLLCRNGDSSVVYRIDAIQVETNIGTLYPVLFKRVDVTDAVSRKLEEDALNKARKEIDRQVKENSKRIADYARHVVMPLLTRLKRDLPEEKMTVYNSIIKALREMPLPDDEVVKGMEKLTPREVEITNLIREGRSSEEISEELDISVKTVQKHRNIIRKKLNIINKGINLKSFLRREI